MNTATWASMEADSGGAVPKIRTADWGDMVRAIGYYQMRTFGYSHKIALLYYGIVLLNPGSLRDYINAR